MKRFFSILSILVLIAPTANAGWFFGGDDEEPNPFETDSNRGDSLFGTPRVEDPWVVEGRKRTKPSEDVFAVEPRRERSRSDRFSFERSSGDNFGFGASSAQKSKSTLEVEGWVGKLGRCVSRVIGSGIVAGAGIGLAVSDQSNLLRGVGVAAGLLGSAGVLYSLHACKMSFDKRATLDFSYCVEEYGGDSSLNTEKACFLRGQGNKNPRALANALQHGVLGSDENVNAWGEHQLSRAVNSRDRAPVSSSLIQTVSAGGSGPNPPAPEMLLRAGTGASETIWH